MKDSQEVVELLKKLVKYVKPKLATFFVAVNKETLESLFVLRGKLYERKQKANAKKGVRAEIIWEKVGAHEFIDAIKKYGITSKKLNDLFKKADEVMRFVNEMAKDPEIQKELAKPG
ncbi:MAG: hypothetical protein HYT12_04900 [Candidatus Liptonbacteria bacterium]|nr:hypothetical protein [Candidatus Liptonbacteria bacterium]